ncbi:unnamed protein product [Oppiella nova]|uniref:Uncharacterized protein n=1 Tax=Oppiella nova TaxID=334625 RepID=A0A7R9M4C2_9ACAR|nr:unnamed protein product [Oppiella nova]CAG2170426.1 unnamed protein product [Oppiella nova]
MCQGKPDSTKSNCKYIIMNLRARSYYSDSLAMVCVDFYMSYELVKQFLECVQYLHESVDTDIIDWKLNPKNILIADNVRNGRVENQKLLGININNIHDFLNSLKYTADVEERGVEDVLNEFKYIFTHNIEITDNMISTFQTHFATLNNPEYNFFVENAFVKAITKQ